MMPELPALEKSLDDPFPGVPVGWEDEPVKPEKPAKKEPPVKTTIPKPTPRNTWTQATAVEKNLLEGVEFLGGGLMLLPGALGADGQLFYERFPAVVHELVELGKEDKRFRVFLERLSMPGKYGPLLAASFPLLLGIAVNHNLLPASLFGIGTPAQADSTGGEK